MKDDLQAVAVKLLRRGEDCGLSREAFAQEIAMMQWLSRDANIVQFFGACMNKTRGMMLVTELMVRLCNLTHPATSTTAVSKLKSRVFTLV